MAANKCDSCFYSAFDKDLEAPCASCSGYSNWVTKDAYPVDRPYTDKPLTEAIKAWFAQRNDVPDPQYNVVEKPKHYMLFEEQGIEVRDVIEKLVWKVKMSTDRKVPDWEMTPMFDSDYTQMMQYLMRFMDKNGVEDLKKARWYLDKLIDSYEHHV
jgi:hypothetical protein